MIRALKSSSNEIEISNESEKRTVSLVFSVENGELKGNWLKYLVQHTKENYKYVLCLSIRIVCRKIFGFKNRYIIIFRWKKAAEKIMEVQLLETNRHSFVKPERHGSLYDETPLFGK